ncbi:MAG: cell division protein FtsX [Thermoanaerobaculia bacterium]
MLGLFLLGSHNLAALVEQWRREARILVYFAEEASADAMARFSRRVESRPEVREVSFVDREQANARFVRLFPNLEGALGRGGEGALPSSLEIQPRPGSARAVVRWLRGQAADPVIGMVDDDREWLARLQALVGFLRFVGLALGGILLAASVFTIAAVVRLAFYLYREEISVMRLVGATELYVRGPFYLSGVLLGLVGGLAGVAGLILAYRIVAPAVPVSIFAAVVEGGFLPWSHLALLVLVGAAAGLAGAVVSLRREG